MEIINASEKDIFDIMDILNYSIIHETARFDEDPLSVEEMKQWLEEHDERYPVICAVEDGKIIGWASIGVFNKKSAFRFTVENSIYIHQDYRGKGAGKLLLQRLIDESKKRGYKAIIALITGNNDGSIKLHEQFGFEFSGTMKKVGYKFNTWLDVVIMELILG